MLPLGGAWWGGSSGNAGLCRGPALGSIPAAGGSAPPPAGSPGHGCSIPGRAGPPRCRDHPPARAAPSPSHSSATRAEPQGQRWPPPRGLDPEKLLSSPSTTATKRKRRRKVSLLRPGAGARKAGSPSSLLGWLSPLTVIPRFLSRDLAARCCGRAEALPGHFSLTKALREAASPPPLLPTSLLPNSKGNQGPWEPKATRQGEKEK